MDNQNNMNTGTGGTSTGGSSSSAGPIIGAIVILAIIILGGLYFWSQRAGDAAMEQTMESINSQGTSDEASAIEADINSTDVENLDAELNAS